MTLTRNTRQRRLVLGLMEDNTSHPTADELYDLARTLDPHISRGTIYRNLGLLAEAGEVQRLPMPHGPDHFDSRLETHYHFLCRRCFKVVDSQLPYRSELNLPSPDLPGYQVEWHRLLLVGLCPDCAKD